MHGPESKMLRDTVTDACLNELAAEIAEVCSAMGYFWLIPQTSSYSISWSSVINVFGEAVLHPLASCAPGRLLLVGGVA